MRPERAENPVEQTDRIPPEAGLPDLPRSRRSLDLIAIVFVVLAVGMAAVALRDQLTDVLAAVKEIAWWRAAGGLFCVVLGLMATAEVWRQSLKGLGHDVGARAAREIFFPAQAGKYLPGSIWPFLVQMRYAAQRGVPASVTLLAGSVFLVIHAVTAVLVGALLLVSQPDLAAEFRWIGWIILAAPAVLHPRVVTALARLLARRSGTPAPELRWAHLAHPIAWMLPAWLAYGAAVLLLAAPFTDSPVALALVCVSAFALAWIAGLVVVIAPAGVGAREAVLVVSLAPMVGVAAATTVALIVRVAHTVADALLAVYYGLIRNHRRRRTGPARTDPDTYVPRSIGAGRRWAARMRSTSSLVDRSNR